MGQEKGGYHTRKEGPKKINEKGFQRKEIGRQSNRRRMKEARKVPECGKNQAHKRKEPT